MAQMMPQMPYGAPQPMPYAAQPQMPYGAPPTPRYQAPAPLATPMVAAPQPQQNRQQPIFRAQAADEPEQRSTLRLPSPEALGIGTRKPTTAIDWTIVHQRLDQLGATCFQKHRLPDGGCRITCLLPSQPGTQHRIDTQATSEAEALRLALDQAERWAARR